MDTIEVMRAYAAVAEAGSFSEAARRLGLSKALASKYVSRLEERLGVRLLNRTTRAVSMTEVGRAYFGRCKRILSEIEELEAAVSDQHATPRGTLRVAGPRAFGEDMLVAEVGRFLARYPEIDIELVLDERQVDIVAEGFDVAIRIDALKDSALIARRIADYPYIICASAEYLKRSGAPENPADLARHPCIVNTAISPTGQWQFLVDGLSEQIPVQARARVSSARATATLVGQDLGIGLCLESTVRRDLETGKLVRLLTPFEAYDRSIYAVYPHSRHLSGKVRAFVDHLLAAFKTG